MIYDISYFNDYLPDLEKRVQRSEADSCWSEDSATRIAYVATNIEVELTSDPEEYSVYSLVTLHRNMNEGDEHTIVGHRENLLRRVSGVMKLARRKIILDQNILLNKKLDNFL